VLRARARALGRARGRADVQRFLLPPPSDISAPSATSATRSGIAGWYTFKEALGGFADRLLRRRARRVVLVALSRLLRTAIMPYAIAANAIPIIAFAPITNQWFGLLNPLSKMAIARSLLLPRAA
jgi:NitT/TauT family transport system permease protein